MLPQAPSGFSDALCVAGADTSLLAPCPHPARSSLASSAARKCPWAPPRPAARPSPVTVRSATEAHVGFKSLGCFSQKCS